MVGNHKRVIVYGAIITDHVFIQISFKDPNEFYLVAINDKMQSYDVAEIIESVY